MSQTIKIDFGYLLELKSSVDTTITSLTADFGTVADIPSDPNVDERIRKFSGDWDKRREELAGSLETISAAVQAIHDSFLEADESLVAELEGEN